MTPLIEARDISKTFGRQKPWWARASRAAPALDRVSVKLEPGASLGLVGESGCGKTTLARILIGLEVPSAGEVLWNGRPAAEFTGADWRRNWGRVQYVFQDAKGALNPRHRVETLLEAPLVTLLGLPHTKRSKRIDELLNQVGLSPAYRGRYPHELSGGQAQRIVLARALAAGPEALILDEPVSSLDVSIQAQILVLLRELRARLGLAYLFISHDLAVVERLCSQVAVMRHGKVVEQGALQQVFQAPQDDYTKTLLRTAPRMPSNNSG